MKKKPAKINRPKTKTSGARLPLCLILGGGGHAKVLLDVLQASKLGKRLAILDSDPKIHGQLLDGVPVLGGDELLPELANAGVKFFAVGVGSVGDSRLRERLFKKGISSGLNALSIVAPSAIVSSRTLIGEGCQLLPASVVNTGARLGVNVIVNTGAIVEHDCVVGEHAHLATGARLCGGVQVGVCAHIGAGAVVRQGIKIGERAVIGAGAAVVKDVPPGAIVAGVPAQPLKKSS